MKSLVIAYYYLCEASSTGQILRRFFPELVKKGYQIDLFCKEVSTQSGDMNSEHLIPVKENSRLILCEKIIRNLGLNDILMTPDYYRYTWGHFVKKRLASIDVRDYDYVHTISFPSSSHLLGYYAKIKFGIPWVAQFYDPWHNNPFRPIESKVFQQIDAKLEKRVADYADAVILPCQEVADDWIERYGTSVKDKIHILPFVISTPPINIHKKSSGLTISQIGTSNSKRSSDDFLIALSRVLEAHPNYREKLRVNYVGLLSEQEVQMISSLRLDDIVYRPGRISEIDCIEYFESSDVFLAVDASLEKNFFFPSKILKYFYYQKPILGLTAENSVLKRVLTESKNFAIPLGNIDDIVLFIERAIESYDTLNCFDKSYWERFTPSTVVNKFTKIINSIL